MANSNIIAPVGAIPAAMPVIQRKPKQQQDDLPQDKQEAENKHPTTDDNNKNPQATDGGEKTGGVDRYA